MSGESWSDSGSDNFGSGSTVPGTVPGGTVPGSTVPGSTVPGNGASGSTLPGGTLPGGTVPGNGASGSFGPGSTLPGSTLPGSSLPGSTVPGNTVPDDTASDDIASDNGTALRLLAVHAHPDDESSKGAATMAGYVAEGVQVLVATLTGGERGDILNPALDRPEVRSDIARIRREEMTRAREILGVQQRFLGFVDSGLPEGDPPSPLPDGCFALQPLDAATAPLTALVREFRPHVIITYDESGGYPHPITSVPRGIHGGIRRGRRSGRPSGSWRALAAPQALLPRHIPPGAVRGAA